MTYTVTKLITNSWYLSGIVSRDLETITADQLTGGLDLLNSVLAIKTADKKHIPYFTVYDGLTLVQGQTEYFVENLISVQSMTFFQDTVRYSMIPTARKDYFATGRVEGIQSLPSEYHIERTLNGTNIFLYFYPMSNYPTQIVGKFSLASVSLNQDLLETIDLFYIEYLRYCLANYMCEEYNITFQPQAADKLKQYEAMMIDVSPIDFSMSKISTLQGSTSLNYGDINIGHGWRPG